MNRLTGSDLPEVSDQSQVIAEPAGPAPGSVKVSFPPISI
jgi:hypothetical protein